MSCGGGSCDIGSGESGNDSGNSIGGVSLMSMVVVLEW